MSPILLTIFTPTFNRAHTLVRLYEGLLKQTEKVFEWLIVDDGSTDGTKNLVEGFIQERKLNIRYFYQENQGKHIAINKGVSEARGNYFLTIDSDDYLLENAVEVCEKLISEIDSKKDFAGFTYIHFQEGTPYKTENYGKKRWTQHENYQWEFYGEMAFCYKTEILKKFPFPQFPGEKFCPESLIHHRIGNNFTILYTDYVLASGDYLEGGLSSEFSRLMEKNPRTAMLFYSEKLQSQEFDKTSKKMYTQMYWNIARQAKHISFREKLSGISLRWSLWYFSRKFFKKIGF